MGLERVGGHAGIVAPDLVQQHLARDRPVADPVEVLQDRGLLLGQVDLPVVAAHQHLGRRLEAVGADREHRVVAELELAQLGAQAGQQHAQAERLGDVVVGPAVEAQDRVGVAAVRGQHDHRRLHALLAQQAADVAAVHVGQADIEQDGGERVLLGELQGLLAGAGLAQLEALVQRQLLDELAAQGRVVVDDEDEVGRVHDRFEIRPAAATSGDRATDRPGRKAETRAAIDLRATRHYCLSRE